MTFHNLSHVARMELAEYGKTDARLFLSRKLDTDDMMFFGLYVIRK